MSPVRLIKCPKCGVRHFIGHPCDHAEGLRPQHTRKTSKVIQLLVIVVATFLITTTSIWVARVEGNNYGIATALSVFLVLYLIKLACEWNDGIDFLRLMLLPAPLDWGDQFDRLINFWTMPRPYFRAVYVASLLSLIIVFIVCRK